MPKNGTKVIATTDQLTSYALNSTVLTLFSGYTTLDNPEFIGGASVNGYPVLLQATFCTPTFDNIG